MLYHLVKLTVISVIAFSSAVFAQSTDKIILPELGSPEANTASVQPNLNALGAGFNYRDNINGKIFSVSPQYNRHNGTAIDGSLASPFGKNMATGILLMSGQDRNEWLLNAGIDFNNHHRIIFSLGKLRQNLNFNFISGAEKTQITQKNIAASYQYLLDKYWINTLELNTYASDAISVKLSDKTFFTDTASLYELWNDPRRIAGGGVTGLQGRLVFMPTLKTTIKIGLGAERLTYDYLIGNESTTRATGSAELLQRLEYDFNFRASVSTAASQSRYAIGIGKSFKEGLQIGFDIANIRGRDNTYNDTQLRLTLTQSFGRGNTSASAINTSALRNVDATDPVMNQAHNNTPVGSKAGNTWTSSLVEQVSRRPSFLPSQVIAKIDTTSTPVRLIAIDKVATPPGSTVATATGIYTVPTVTPVSGISSISLNGSAFTNSGQFALSGNNLVINPNLITQPAVGSIDTYIVTMSNATGGGTTLATVKVSHGSTKIDSVVISSGTLNIGASISGVTAPVGGATPVTSVSGTGYTGTVTWSPVVSGTFAYNTAYTATVTLTPATGYTATGVTANYFTVSGATATNAANSGVVSAVFSTTPNQVIGAAISGVTAPVGGATPVTSVSGTGYTGIVTWSPVVSGTFAYNTAYTAAVTLTPATGYTATGVTANYFTVSGATATNAANSGVVSAVFPTTLNQVIGATISGVTPPVSGAIPVTSVSGTGYTGTVTWGPTVSGTFAGGTAYTATVLLTPATGYTATGVTSNFFNVSGATATNAANSGVVSAVFPATATPPGFFTIGGVTSTPPSTGGYVNYAEAVGYCSGLTTSGKTWRLPTHSELSALNTSLVAAGYDNIQPPSWPPLSQTWTSTSNGSGGFKTMYMPYSATDLSTSRSTSELAVTLCVTS